MYTVVFWFHSAACSLALYIFISKTFFKNVNCVYVWRGYITCIWVLVVHVPLEAKRRCDISRARVCEFSESPLGNLAWAFWQAQMLSCWAIPQALEFFINFVYVPVWGSEDNLCHFFPHLSWGPSSSHWAWQQVPLPSKPSQWLSYINAQESF